MTTTPAYFATFTIDSPIPTMSDFAAVQKLVYAKVAGLQAAIAEADVFGPEVTWANIVDLVVRIAIH